MAVKRTGQTSFLDAWLPGGLGGSARLDPLASLVKWYRFEKILAGLTDAGGPGRPAYPALVMFKALLLQSLYGLSDPELEDALGDRLSFRRFVGLSLEDPVPDHSTICRFRKALVAAGTLEKLFTELDRQLEKAGVIVKRGTMLDATVIATGASAKPPKDGEAHDPQAGFAKRQGKAGAVFGYKAHVGVDVGSGVVRRVITTAANVPDTVPADDLICGDEGEVLADAAYHTHAREARLRAAGIKPRLMRRANRHHPTLPRRVRHLNRLIARRRAAVETTFATWKRRMGVTAIRYVGLVKAAAQVTLVAMAFNLRRWVTLASA